MCDFSNKDGRFLKLNSYSCVCGGKEHFENYSANINSQFTGSITFSANKNSVSTISKPPAQKMVCYMMSVLSLLFSVVRQTKGKEEKQFPLQTLNF